MNINLPRPDLSQKYLFSLTARLKAIFLEINSKTVRKIGTTAPTTGTWAQGDIVWNSAPIEAGLVSSKYVISNWVCVVGGTPGTWLENRGLTGN